MLDGISPFKGVPCKLKGGLIIALDAANLGLKALGFLSIVALIAEALFILILKIILSMDAVSDSTAVSARFEAFSIKF